MTVEVLVPTHRIVVAPRHKHLAAFRTIRAERPTVVIPGHNPPITLSER